MKIEKSTLLGEKTKTSRSRQLNIKCMRDRIRSDEREWEVCRWRRRKMYRNPQHFHSIYSTAGYANLGRRSCWITFSLSASLAANKFTFLSRFCKWSHRRTRRNESCVLYIWTRKKIRKFTKIKDCRSKKKSSQRSMTVVVNREYRKTVWMTKKSYFIQAHGRLDDAIHPIEMNRKNAFANEPLSSSIESSVSFWGQNVHKFACQSLNGLMSGVEFLLYTRNFRTKLFPLLSARVFSSFLCTHGVTPATVRLTNHRHHRIDIEYFRWVVVVRARANQPSPFFLSSQTKRREATKATSLALLIPLKTTLFHMRC